MKVYYLRYTESDFTKTGQVWKTPVIDLYDNAQYKNYSTTKVSFGLDSLGNGVYTGIQADPDLGFPNTDIGLVSGGRFIDYSGRIDIVAWNIDYDIGVLGTVPLTLSVYSSVSNDNSYMGDWSSKGNILQDAVVFANDVERNAFFELHWNGIDETILANTTLEMFIRIEIDPPLVAAFFPETGKLQYKFPEWMALREYDALDPSSLLKSTPTTIGGSFFNAVAGEWLNDMRGKIDYIQFQALINTVDLSQKAWVYETANVPNFIYSITGDGVELARVTGVSEFYDTLDDEDAFLWNEATRAIFCNKEYTSLLINGVAHTQTLYHTWNTIDDIGVSVDLFRLFNEGNESFKKRIMDVYRNRPGVGVDAFKLALRRELNLWKYASPSATPNSEYQGATPELLEMKDLERDPEFFAYDGMPTPRFMSLIEELARLYPMTWGYFRYNNAFWDADGSEKSGIATIPRLFDATPITEDYLESGVGDGNDMYVMRPGAYTGARTFNTKLKIRGRQKTIRTEYPGLTFNINVYGQASDNLYDTPEGSPKFTLELTIDGVVYYHNFQVAIHSDATFTYATPTFRSHGNFTWMTESLVTDLNVDLHTKSLPSTLYGGSTPAQAPASAITKVEIKPGWFDPDAGSYADAPDQGAYRLWFTDESSPGLGLGFGGSSTSILINGYNASSRAGTGTNLSLESKIQSPILVSNSFSSDRSSYTITINGDYPGMIPKSSTITLPIIPWPASTETITRRYVVEITTTDGVTTGAYSDDLASTPIFLNDNYILAEGQAGWINGVKSFPASSTSITFSSASGPAYPVQVPTWSMFEAEQLLPITGTVDQNGPWRSNQPQPIGNTNYLLDYKSLKRSDFGLADNENYIITWLGVSTVSDGQVIVWIDTNTVQPAVTDDAETVIIAYPENVITETLNPNDNMYHFSTFALKARLKPGVTEEWFPKAHSGWFYDDVEEYYMYAQRVRESATESYKVLGDLNRLGAPIIVHGKAADLESTPLFPLRQVAFWDLDATPNLSLTNIEQVEGTGVNVLYASYNDIYNITVKDLHTGLFINPISTSFKNNSIMMVNPTDRDHIYELSYTLRYSFYANNEYQDPVTGNQRTHLTFDATPSTIGLDEYVVDYETSVYDPATPIDIPLNTFHTSTDEGFIFIDHDVHALRKIELRIDPGKIMADGSDYSLVTVKAYDEFGNPKPFQTFNMYTNFGTLSKATVTTDRDGFASLTLQASHWSNSLNPFPATPGMAPATPNLGDQVGGIIKASSTLEAETTFGIYTNATPDHTLTAMPVVDAVPADGASEIYIIGKVESAGHQGIPAAVVFWKRDRYLYQLFRKDYSNSAATPGRFGTAGRVIADGNGRFRIGPFVAATPSEPGHWLLSAESSYATPSFGSTPGYAQVGDIVYWQEYTDTSFGVENISGMPTAPMQYATPSWQLPAYTLGSAFPVTYDETDYEFGHQPGLIFWTPPRWYAIDRYMQYQMGLLGNDYWTYNQGATPHIFPDYKEF